MVILRDSTPMAKVRVLYIGSAVPLETVAGLDAIQAPLKERYPVDNEASIEGIDAVLTITNSCIQMQYLHDSDQIVQFPISTLTLCAAVRCISEVNGATGEKLAKFVSLNDPLAGGDNSKHPAIFTAITRRTQGRKVLECHGFICSSSKDAMQLVKCASIAGKNYKQNGTVTSHRPTVVNRPAHTNGATNGFIDPLLDAEFGSPRSEVQNGQINAGAMRLVPGEPVANVAAGPEFFEPVSTQGYFYSSNKAEVKRYNIARLGGDKSKDTSSVIMAPASEREGPTSARVNGHAQSPTLRSAPPRMHPAPPPIYIRTPRSVVGGPPPPPPPGPRMFFYGPPPPPPPPMYGRPRFFSPPPPRFRQVPFMMPGGPPPPPPPMMAAPIYVRRPRGGSEGSRSNSSDSRGSRGSRSKTPVNRVNGEDTEPKHIPNADESSDESIRADRRQRPSTPPTDYDDRRKGERMSRRDAYEVRVGVQPSPYRYGPPPDVIPPYGYDYYVQPPRHGGYAPFTMYNPHIRSRSVPPFERNRSKSPHKRGKKKKKTKKSKKGHHRGQPEYIYYPREGFKRVVRPEHSDVSTDSFPGYYSEVPRASQKPSDPLSGYQFYPPRDFRRDENQFMNERNFSKSIKEETRGSLRHTKPYATAYELNDALNRGTVDREGEDPDFTMY